MSASEIFVFLSFTLLAFVSKKSAYFNEIYTLFLKPYWYRHYSYWSCVNEIRELVILKILGSKNILRKKIVHRAN